MRSQNKSGGFTKNTTVDLKNPGTSAAHRASDDPSQNKGKHPSLLHMDRDLRFRRHMVPRRHPMFVMDGPHRMMSPHARFMNRSGSPSFMLRGRRPSLISARHMFQTGGQMRPPPPGGFMPPIHGHHKERKDMQREFMKAPMDGERMPGFPQRQEDMSKYPVDFPGRMEDFQGKRDEPFRSGPHPMPAQPNRPMGMPNFGMNKPYSQQGRPMGRYPYGPSRHMMALPPSYKRLMRFPEKYIDLSDYTMDFQGRFMNQQGKYVNPLNWARIHQGRVLMPAPPPIKRRFMQKPERYLDMSRYTMDFNGRYRDNYGRQIDPVEQFNANVERYLHSQPPSYRRLARFPERYMDLSRYTMDFQGRFMDTHGRYVDPLGRFHGNYGKVLMNPPLNQRRFIRHPEKYMDMSAYTMDFQGRFLDRRGRPIDLLGRHSSHPGRFILPGPRMHRDMPMAPRPPIKHMDMSRCTMDFQGRLMDNQGRYVDHMRRFGDQLPPHPHYHHRNFMDFHRHAMDFRKRHMDKFSGPVEQVGKMQDMGPKPNIFFERRSIPGIRPISGPEKDAQIETEKMMQEKQYPEMKTGPEFHRPHSAGAEFEESPRPESASPTPADEERLMLLSMEDEHMQPPFMHPSIHAGMRPHMFYMPPSEKPFMHYPMPEDCFQVPPSLMHFNCEMYMPMQPQVADGMMMMVSELMNTGYPMYQPMEGSMGAHDPECMMDERRWFPGDWHDGIDNEMFYGHGDMSDMMGPGMHKRSSFRMSNEPRQEVPLRPVIEDNVDDTYNEEHRSSRFDDKHRHSMEDKEFDPRHASFGHHEDMDYPGLMPELHYRSMNEYFGHGDHDDYMFDGGYYPDYHMDEFFPKGFMPSPHMDYMNDFQSPYWFEPECMDMSPGFIDEPGNYPCPPYAGDNFGFGAYDEEENEERERQEEEEEATAAVVEEERRHSIRKDIEQHRSPSPMHHPIHSHSPHIRSPSPLQHEEEIEAEVQRRMGSPRSLPREDERFFNDKHARYLEEAAEYLRERGRYLREQHERFLHELEKAGPLSHPQVQAEAEAHATVVEEEVNATEAEAEAVERLARSARRASNVEHHRNLSAGSRHHSVDSQSRFPHKHMDEH